MITCVWSLLVPDQVMLVVVVVVIVTSIFINCHQSDIWLAVSVTVALWHSCCCCFPPPSFAGCCHLCRRRLESLYLPLLLTYIPASSQHLLKISAVNRWPCFTPLLRCHSEILAGWLVGWLSSWFFVLVVVVPMNGWISPRNSRELLRFRSAVFEIQIMNWSLWVVADLH